MREILRHLSRAVIVILAAACFAEPPKDLGLVEQAERTLVQLIVRIRPRTPEHRHRAAHLTKADFSVIFDDTEIPAEQWEIDDFCPEPEADRAPDAPDGGKHVLLFVDALAPEGRDNTKAMLQTMIPRLAADGYRMKILPHGSPAWTSDTEILLRDARRAVEPWKRAADDHGTSLEEDLRALLAAGEIDRAIELARQMEIDAQVSFEGPALQMARAISSMGPLPMPKAMIYFAQRGHSFNEMIVDTAIRAGVAVYAVKADGLAPYVPNVKTVDDPGAIVTTSLSALSEHTGGRLGLGHFRPSAGEKILQRVQSDLSCVYVLSVDAARLDRDRTLRPKIRLRPPLTFQLIAETVPDLTVPSERRLQEEAVAITLLSSGWAGVHPGAVSFVPESFGDGRVTGLASFTLGGGLLLEPGWDIGVHYFGASRVSGYGAIRVTESESDIVFETRVKLPAGPYAIIGVAQEVGGSGLARGTATGLLSTPNKKAVGFLHPPDVLQRRRGSFVSENGTMRAAGWSPLRFGMAASDRAASLVTPLCRGAGVRGTLTIETRLFLAGDEIRVSASAWPEQKGQPCRVARDDLFGSDELPWSGKPYEAMVVVNVHDRSGRTIAKSSKAFWVIGPDR